MPKSNASRHHVFGEPFIGQLASDTASALAVSSLKPSALAPGLPTVAESGVPGLVTLGLYPVLAPAGTPAVTVLRVQREIAQALAQPQTRERLLGAGVEAVGGTPAELAALLRSEMAQWGKLFKQAGILAEPATRGETTR